MFSLNKLMAFNVLQTLKEYIRIAGYFIFIKNTDFCKNAFETAKKGVFQLLFFLHFFVIIRGNVTTVLSF